MPSHDFTESEARLLRALARHGRVRDASAALFISYYTARRHLENMRLKTGLRSIAQLVVRAAEAGLLNDASDHGAEQLE